MLTAVRITLMTIFITFFLACLKIAGGHYGFSHALLADGFHSIADIFIDILVLFAAFYGNQKADHNHPYGHGRIETAASFGLALVLLITGAGIIWDAGRELYSIWFDKIISVPDKYIVWIALTAIVLNELIFRYTLFTARKNQSSLLEANAWHSRSDAAVSVVVLLGIIGALWGFIYLDAIGAIFVGIMIIKMGLTLAWKSISELVDTGVNPSALAHIRYAISNTEGVSALHLLRTRTINNQIFIDVHVLVSPRISVSEGHYIGDQVIIALRKLPDIKDITVHVDPEDDEIAHPSAQLPSRKVIINMIKQQCRNSQLAYPDSNTIRLHYLNGKIEIEISIIHDKAGEYKNALEHLKNTGFIGKITLLSLPY